MSPEENPPPLPSRGAEPDPPPSTGSELSGGRIHLVDHDPKWRYLFQREAARISEALGERALRVEHVGSTSVPGLVATPCVDVLLLVDDPADEDAYLPDLEKTGYTLLVREHSRHTHPVLKGPDINLNVHVFAPDSAEADRMLRLRDRLRADDGDRELYARTKLELAERRWNRIRDYAEAKSEVIRDILTRA